MSHSIKVVRYRDLPSHKPQSFQLAAMRRIQCHDLDHRFARLGDNERLAVGGSINQLGQLSFGFLDIDDSHKAPNKPGYLITNVNMAFQ